ncbi:DUF2018 family protein [Campylobacter suis]|uniref:DUF2018 family protein n=1 Tax=Campylobacter suis TaxID=2790657 RepID=A0ABM8Q1B7_9BACT|nr:DUF2018 family protein [Campylobacter suis]CAD7286619.1 hypothetical protein LMG8286_00452 [Campylobacter suis]
MIDIFESSPKQKFYDILFNANQNLVSTELDEIFKFHATMRLFLEENGFKEAEILDFLDKNEAAIDSEINDFYIQVSGEILSKNE